MKRKLLNYIKCRLVDLHPVSLLRMIVMMVKALEIAFPKLMILDLCRWHLSPFLVMEIAVRGKVLLQWKY
jgi:hypothetical protein